MATRDNKYGVDRWTSNGHGIKVGPQTPEQKEAIKRINAELAASAKVEKNKKKPAQKKPTAKRK